MLVEVFELLCFPFFCIVVCCGIERYCDYEVMKEAENNTLEQSLLNKNNSDNLLSDNEVDVPLLKRPDTLNTIDSINELEYFQSLCSSVSSLSSSIQMTTPQPISDNIYFLNDSNSSLITQPDSSNPVNILGSAPIGLEGR